MNAYRQRERAPIFLSYNWKPREKRYNKYLWLNFHSECPIWFIFLMNIFLLCCWSIIPIHFALRHEYNLPVPRIWWALLGNIQNSIKNRLCCFHFLSVVLSRYVQFLQKFPSIGKPFSLELWNVQYIRGIRFLLFSQRMETIFKKFYLQYMGPRIFCLFLLSSKVFFFFCCNLIPL